MVPSQVTMVIVSPQFVGYPIYIYIYIHTYLYIYTYICVCVNGLRSADQAWFAGVSSHLEFPN